MTSQVVALGFDAVDPLVLARFWAAALRWPIGERAEGAVALVPDDDCPFPVVFRPVAEPKSGRNRIHLDLTTSSTADQRDTVLELVELGGHHIDVGQRPEEGHVVLADPEGNELCIIEPNNNFLAGAGRLGAVNCDGTRPVGCFWSDALGWPLVWDQDEETAIRAPSGVGPLITWSGPPLIAKVGKNRLHLDIAPSDGGSGDQAAEVERLVSVGARRADIGQSDVGWTALVDPDDNEFWVVSSLSTRL